MKKLFLTLLTCTLLSAVPTYAADPDISTIERSTTHLIISDASGQPTGRCTGEFISEKLYLTAGHCIDGEVYTAIFPGGRNVSLEPVAYSQAGDVGLFKVKDADFVSLSFVPIASFVNFNNDAQILIYCFNGDDTKASQFMVNYQFNGDMQLGDNAVKTHEVIVSNSMIVPGCSGGGAYVTDNQGNYTLVGVVSGTFKFPHDPTKKYGVITQLNSIHNILE